jgi:hypothetical protein
MGKQLLCAGLALTLLSGCLEALEEQTKKSDDFIIGKTTQEIARLDPKDEVVDLQKTKDESIVLTASLQVYTREVVKLNQSVIKHAMNLYHASTERYPKDYEEFMREIIKANNIRLPKLPKGLGYAYDEVNRELMVIEVETTPEPDKKTPADEQN